jgi:hypothetical protein
VVQDPRGPIVNPVADLASLRAQLRAALVEIDALEKAQAEASAPKSEEDIKQALSELDAAQKQIEAARAELQQQVRRTSESRGGGAGEPRGGGTKK